MTKIGNARPTSNVSKSTKIAKHNLIKAVQKGYFGKMNKIGNGYCWEISDKKIKEIFKKYQRENPKGRPRKR